MRKAGQALQGRVIDGKFYLNQYLGGSERSAVFLTERPQGTPRIATIKLVPADPASADLQLSRWKLISRLSHLHLLQVWEAGRCRLNGEDMLYVVMEHAEETLAQVLPERALTPEETHHMLQAALEMLAHLHGRGFVHAHLKPANVLVVGDQLKLSSDGICRIGESVSAHAGIYSAPELPFAAAAPEQDIWSLGVLVAQALTQLLPVRNASGETGVIVSETVPPPFADLVQNCLQQDPQRRCTLEEIAEHLHYKLPARTLGPPALPAEPASTQRPVPGQVAQRAARKKQSALPAVAIVLSLAAVVAVSSFYRRKPAQPEGTTATLEIPAAAQQAKATTTPERRSASRTVSADRPPVALSSRAESSSRPSLKTASDAPSAPSSQSPANPTSGGMVPGKVLQQVLPDVPRSASNTIRGTVRVTVRVRVDTAGDITDVDFVSAGPSQYFARLSAEAAREWKFSPASRGRQAIASTWQVRFEYTRNGDRAIPTAMP
jgi:TonB family protein